MRTREHTVTARSARATLSATSRCSPSMTRSATRSSRAALGTSFDSLPDPAARADLVQLRERASERIVDPSHGEVADRTRQRIAFAPADVSDLRRARDRIAPDGRTADEHEVMATRFALVIHAGHPFGKDVEPGLLTNFANGGIRRRLTELARAAGDLPVQLTVTVTHEQHAA